MESILVLSDDAPWRDALISELVGAGHTAHASSISAFLDDPGEDSSRLTALVVDLRDPSRQHPPLGRVRQAVSNPRAYVLAALSRTQLDHLDFTTGFDDFLADPLSGHEVTARIRQLRWRANRTDMADLLCAGDLVINLASCEVSLRGVPLTLTYQEYELLRYLVEHRGRVFTREQLLSELWGYNYYGGTRTVDVHIRRLRAKLGPEHEELIQTVRNVGYRFRRDAWASRCNRG
ncbi:MAG TPA: response regulator transcription factor [Armatimonadetes bacterium]|jgi:DNA-binding response OmpR family regulator|nr:response regulator transcription factor [Armatimonadota bacterium]